MRADARAFEHGRRKADAIQAVIDAHFDFTADLKSFVREHAEKREREKSVRDGAAEGRFGTGAGGILVDPLVVAGGIGEGIYAELIDDEPIAHGNFFSDLRLQLLDGFDDDHKDLRRGLAEGAVRRIVEVSDA